MQNPVACILMAKQPQVGRTKTRLCPPLTHLEAANLYAALLQDTISLAAGLGGMDLAIAVTPPEAISYFNAISPRGTLLLPIQGKDIGECLMLAFAKLLDLGYSKALALSTDGPTLPGEYIRQAMDALDENDIVLGPSEDGGYNLIGLKQPHPTVFQDIEWSTSKVLAQTGRQASLANLRLAFTPPWHDVDNAADLHRLYHELHTLPADRLVYTRAFFSTFDVRRLAGAPNGSQDHLLH
jgi:uncharacterized protein